MVFRFHLVGLRLEVFTCRVITEPHFIFRFCNVFFFQSNSIRFVEKMMGCCYICFGSLGNGFGGIVAAIGF